MKKDSGNELIFDLESIEQLSPKKKADYLELAIKNSLSQHPEGITAQLLSELTGISQRTVKKHLDQLTATRAAVRKEYGSRIAIYFPISKQDVGPAPKTIEVGESIYQLQLIENTWGRFVYVQERKKDVYSGMTKTLGGVMIDCDGMLEFVKALKEVASNGECISDGEGLGEL